MKKCILITLCTCVMWLNGAAQIQPKTEIDMGDFVEDLFGFQDEDIDYEDLYETLFQFYRNPIDLNMATPNELRGLYILTESQVQAIFKYREDYGNFLTVFELAAIPNLGKLDINRLLPFIKVEPGDYGKRKKPFLERAFDSRNQLLLTRYERVLETRRGHEIPDDPGRSRYLGNPDRYYMRYRSQVARDFSLGFTAEKDPGEPFNWMPNENRYLFDYLSGHIALYNRGIIKSVVVGDYQLQIGQGLLLAGGFQIGKGAAATSTVRRASRGVRPYTAVLESNFFRGTAATVDLGRFDLTAFYSNQLIDGNVMSNATDTLSDSFQDFVRSLYQTGFHRTQTEIDGRNQIREVVSGSNIKYESKNQQFEVGLTAVNTTYSLPITRRPNNYNQFEFTGKDNLVIGGNVNWQWRTLQFFGEAGRSQSGGLGAVAGVTGSLSPNVDFAMVMRNYDKDFHSFYGNAFGESTRNINEKGIYLGINIRPNDNWDISVYYDQFRFPWLRFRADAPSNGDESLLRVTYKPNRRLVAYAQYRYEDKGRNLMNSDAATNVVVPTIRQNYMLNLDYQASEIIKLKSRIQGSSFTQAGTITRGFALIQDINVDLDKFRFSSRFAFFDTDDFENRQFAFERNVLYAFALPAYFGQGYRNYYLVQYKLNRSLDFWLRYAFTTYRDRDTISSGLQQIDGNTQTQVTAQMRFKF